MVSPNARQDLARLGVGRAGQGNGFIYVHQRNTQISEIVKTKKNLLACSLTELTCAQIASTSRPSPGPWPKDVRAPGLRLGKKTQASATCLKTKPSKYHSLAPRFTNPPFHKQLKTNRQRQPTSKPKACKATRLQVHKATNRNSLQAHKPTTANSQQPTANSQPTTTSPQTHKATSPQTPQAQVHKPTSPQTYRHKPTNIQPPTANCKPATYTQEPATAKHPS